MRHRHGYTLAAAVLLAAVGVVLAPTLPAIVDRFAPATLHEMITPGFLLVLLASWAGGSLIFTSRRGHR